LNVERAEKEIAAWDGGKEWKNQVVLFQLQRKKTLTLTRKKADWLHGQFEQQGLIR
jgi:hypothetical protein